MATSTLYGSSDLVDPLPDLLDEEDLQTGPPKLSKDQRIRLALRHYHEINGTPQAKSICQIAIRFRISRTTLQDRIKGAKSRQEVS